MYGVVGYGEYKVLKNCLDSIYRLKTPNDHVVLFQNGIRYLNSILNKFDDISVIRSKNNVGPASGRNILIDCFLKKDQFTHLFFVDYDASIIIEDKKTFYSLMRQEFGILAPILKYPNGKILSTGIDICLDNIEPIYYNKEIQSLTKRDTVMTTAAIISRRVLKKGIKFNSGYFAYWEDLDFSYKVKNNHFINYVTPCIIATHPIQAQEKRFHVSYYMARNHLYFISDNFKLNNKLIFRNLFKYFRDFFSIPFLINSDFRRHLFASLIGINDYFLKRKGLNEKIYISSN